MSVIIKLDANEFIEKGYTYQSKDVINYINMHTVALITESEANQITKFLKSCDQINLGYIVKTKGYEQELYITYDIIYENIDPIIDIFKLDKIPFVMGINLYNILIGEIKVLDIENEILEIHKMQNPKLMSYINYLIESINNLPYLYKDDIYPDTEKFYNLDFVEYCIQYLWKYLYIQQNNIYEIGLKNIILQYLDFASYEFVNLNNEKFRISLLPLFDDFTFIISKFIILIFDNDISHEVYDLIEDKGSEGIFISNLQWNKYKSYQIEWDKNNRLDNKEYTKINNTKIEIW